MVNKQLRPAASCLLFLNFCMYIVVLAISGWAMNKIINHGNVGGGENAATLYFILFSLISGTVGAVSCSFGLNHVSEWGPESLPAAAAAATVAWSLTILALGFACKHIKLETNNQQLKTLEAFIIILSATMGMYIGSIHGAMKRVN
ncbi:unnamed protein product [Amaranthus hypochondriacus]